MQISPLQRTAHASAATIQDMCIDHRCRDVCMTEQLLDGANVVTIFQQVRGEGVA